MARDYAKYQSPSHTKKKLAAQGWGQRLLLTVLVIGVLSAIIIGVFVYKYPMLAFSQQHYATWIAQLQSNLHHKKIKTALLAKTPSVPQEPEVRFNFYTELPNMQVTLSETEATQSAPSAKANTIVTATKTESLLPKELKKNKNSAENANQYILQLGVFKNATAAGQSRVSLLLAGFEVEVVQNTEENAQIYRVQKGPYATLAQAKEVQKQLQRKGITGLIKTL